MKTLSLVAILSVCSVAFGQESSDLFEKAPPPIDEALRARIHDFYQAHIDGKFREAMKLVAEDSQDMFFAAPKPQYKECETVRINYSEQFTKALVVESCKGDWVFHGQSAPMTLPISSNWKLVDGQWYFCYVKPKTVTTPFGTINVTDAADAKPGSAPVIPQDPLQAARGILTMVKVDKMNVNLRADQPSKEEIHISNEMPGSVSISIDPVTAPGLKITPAKTELPAKGETTVTFEYRPPERSDSKTPSSVTAQIHINPTGQVLPIQLTFLKSDDAK